MSKEREKQSQDHAGRQKANRDSFLETVESFVVAFILAFVFRAYVVEAFVIPTGSMAPRLNGEHFEFVCANCGYPYNVGLDKDSNARGGSRSVRTEPVCPLCFSDSVKQATAERFFGDRILVVKYFYDFFPPRRWDVIVFKYPITPQENFIKRLIGLPNEMVEIRGGDIFIDGKVARKPDRAQEALWMPVYDTDYPDAARRDDPRWKVEPAGSRPPGAFEMPLTISPPAGETVYLAYRHRDMMGQEAAIMDFYGYDAWTENSLSPRGTRSDGRNAVTDVQLRATVELKGPGTVEMVLRAYDDTFEVVLPSAGMGQEVQIRRLVRSGGQLSVREVVRGPKDVLPVGRKVELEAANVDHKVVLKVNGRRVIDRSDDQVFDEEDDLPYEPAVPRSQWLGDWKDWAELKVGLRGSPGVVSRLRVNRDVYYTSELRQSDSGRRSSGGSATEGHPYTLGPDEFFALGDNSPRSLDGRWWKSADETSAQPVIPRENLVGKAFFVYWPSAGARYGIPIRAVPDVTGFRLIR